MNCVENMTIMNALTFFCDASCANAFQSTSMISLCNRSIHEVQYIVSSVGFLVIFYSTLSQLVTKTIFKLQFSFVCDLFV